MDRKFLLPPATLLLVLIASEIALRRFDFWGIDYLYDQSLFYNGTIEQDGFIVLPPGVIRGKRFTATILDDGTRAVPDTQPSDCQIVFIGDSLTFGFGVNDDETFANLIAINITDAEFINAGVNGYNSQQVSESLARFPDADGFIWLMIGNDLYAPITVGDGWLRPEEVYTVEYWRLWRQGVIDLGDKTIYMERFEDDLAAIAQEGALMFSWNPRPEMTDLLESYSVVDVSQDRKRYQLARTDGHPNADGHQDLANRMLPHVRRYVSEVC